MEADKIPKAYNPEEAEDRIYKLWEESGYFNPDNLPDAENRPPFSMVMPPPNVTGILHTGHAAMLTIEDIIIRYQRMRGKKTLWIPGTDHAAIATQSKVEKEIQKEEGKTRHDLGREEFVKRVSDFALTSKGTILGQVKKIGASVDWSRESYTLDESKNEAVRFAFKKMYDLGLIYQGYRIVNWDPKGQTTISDDEIVYEETKAALYTFRYSQDFPIPIATTRPETKVGDVAVAVHPEDERYKQFIGTDYHVEFMGVPLHIKIIGDESVDPEYGTGALGVTPAHSQMDWEISQRHKLPVVQVINEYAKMIVGPEGFVGKKTSEARLFTAEWLKEKGLLENEEVVAQNLSRAERTNGIVEPLPKIQWFVDVNKQFTLRESAGKSDIKGIEADQPTTLKELMRTVVSNGQIQILPERFEKTYFRWIDNLRDWCISRQIWYGHRVPVWYRDWDQGETEDLYKMGFHERTVGQVHSGKSVTYRTRDHGLKTGQRIALENTQTKEVFGYGTITHIATTTAGKTPINDPAHGTTYNTQEDLIEAFNFHRPGITQDNPVWVYTYSFAPADNNIRERHVGVTLPPGEGWQQDPDTLDTWFSSGLWTFSTLGWPDKTDDLKTYHPTDLLETGYDIIFFWVARMILMSTLLLGEVPFKKVYLHGLVRDEKGRKISKSLGNNIDPVDLINKYGADALRMSMIVGVAPGNDNNLGENKIKGYKHFANKLWNIARYTALSIEDAGFRNTGKPEPKTEADRNILAKLEEVVSASTKALEDYRLHEAAHDLYHFAWHEFADIYIEASKPQLQDEELKENTQAILAHVLNTTLKLLHPFMPFATEEIYQTLHSDGNKKMLMVEQWPSR